MRYARVCAAVALLWAAVAADGLLAAPQRGERQIWDGVYSSAQAERGKAAFDTSCSRCHNVALSGSERGPALKGDEFWSHWEDDSLETLFTKIRDTMPAGGIETVADAGKLDVLTYILQVNGVPPGNEELRVDAGALASIRFVRQGTTATGEASNFALVETVGCLARGPHNEWVLANASEPAVTREESPAKEGISAARAQSLGSLQFRLLSVHSSYAAESHVGHKVEARGLVFRRQGDNRLNLTSLQPLDERCP